MECKAYLEKGKQKNMKKIISNNKGITGIDLTIGIIVLSIFSGVIISLMVNTYSTVVEIRKKKLMKKVLKKLMIVLFHI